MENCSHYTHSQFNGKWKFEISYVVTVASHQYQSTPFTKICIFSSSKFHKKRNAVHYIVYTVKIPFKVNYSMQLTHTFVSCFLLYFFTNTVDWLFSLSLSNFIFRWVYNNFKQYIHEVNINPLTFYVIET